MKMEQTEGSETLEFKLQTPGNSPEESIRHSKHGGSLKSRTSQVHFDSKCACTGRNVQQHLKAKFEPK
jgi:hypothetical protein